MSRSKPSLFRTFSNLEDAREIVRELEHNYIKAFIIDNTPQLDTLFRGDTHENYIEVKLYEKDFKTAKKILEKRVLTDIENVDPDYHLFDFTTEELQEIILKSDEWHEFDYLLAHKILQQRGENVKNEDIEFLKTKRLKELARPERSPFAWIIAGYALSFLGGFLGMIIGFFLWKQKKTLPDGSRVYTYVEPHRKDGKNMFFIGLIVSVISIVVRVFDILEFYSGIY